MKTGIYWQNPKYALRPGRDFTFDPSLVLYLPLHRLAGASFMSKEAHGHLCTVTGALWTPRGRRFDGVDDYIDCGAKESLNLTAAFTVEAWIYPSALTAEGMIYMSIHTDAMNGFFLETDGTRARLSLRNATVNKELYGTMDSLSVGAWFHIVGTFNGNQAFLYLNGVEDINTADVVTPTTNTTSKRIGTNWSANGSWFNGLIGEVRIYNRALTVLEIQRNYLATKWRYQ